MTPAEQNRITAAGKARPRGWWHGFARSMRKNSVPMREIAATFGVTVQAVQYATDPAVRAQNRASKLAHRDGLRRLREARP